MMKFSVWRDSLFFRIASFFAARLGLYVIPAKRIDEAREVAADLASYVERSGHLTNRYHAGRRVRVALGRIHAALGRAWVPKEKRTRC